MVEILDTRETNVLYDNKTIQYTFLLLTAIIPLAVIMFHVTYDYEDDEFKISLIIIPCITGSLLLFCWGYYGINDQRTDLDECQMCWSRPIGFGCISMCPRCGCNACELCRSYDCRDELFYCKVCSYIDRK